MKKPISHTLDRSGESGREKARHSRELMINVALKTLPLAPLFNPKRPLAPLPQPRPPPTASVPYTRIYIPILDLYHYSAINSVCCRAVCCFGFMSIKAIYYQP